MKLLCLLLAALAPATAAPRFIGKTRYLNHARAVVTHTIDDTNKFVPACLDAMDRYGVKATVFISTDRPPINELWPRLRQAIANGHEVGSHSRRHRCQWPDTEAFCAEAYNESEVRGSRDDILRNTPQPYVWSWCYPCGNCAGYPSIHERLRAAGYLVARNYPREAEDGHVVPDLQTWDAEVYNATYTQVVQKKGGIAKSGRTDLAEIDAKFDEVYGKGGIYNFMSHPQWLDYGPDSFYERHLKHVGGRGDVWYVPMGPLYAYRAVWENARVQEVGGGRFELSCELDAKAYPTSVTLEFEGPVKRVRAGGRPLEERARPARWDDEFFRREGNRVYVTVRPRTPLELQ